MSAISQTLQLLKDVGYYFSLVLLKKKVENWLRIVIGIKYYKILINWSNISPTVS